MPKSIGILTSGGDCAGLNAALRAATLRAIQGYGWTVYGVMNGTDGLLSRPLKYRLLDVQTFEGSVLRLGGTILGAINKGDPLAYPMGDQTFKDRSDELIEGCRLLGLDAMIGIGGDGSLKILRTLMEKAQIPFVAIPKTIDNDIGVTENAIGFVTAVDIATEALDRLQPTASSHDRVMVLEVMGRDAGHIALAAGIAGGADVIIIPEIPYKLENIADKIRSILKGGRNFALVVVAEAAKTENGEMLQILDSKGRPRYGGIGHYLSDAIMDSTGLETRFTVLGHVQRGGQPNALDRILASAFGVHAVDLVAAGKFDRMVAWQNRTVTDIPILEAIQVNSCVDTKGALIKTARGLGISLGDTPALSTP